MELNIERRQSNRPSRRTVEQLGVVPDTSGEYTLRDGTSVVIDTSGVNPNNDWTWHNQNLGKKHWPVRIQADPPPNAEVYMQRLREGVEIQLNENGRGSAKLTTTRRLIMRLDKPIWKKEGREVVETNYPQNA